MTKMTSIKSVLGGAVQEFTKEVRRTQVKILEIASKKAVIAKFVIPIAAAEVVVLSLIMQLITKCNFDMSAINTVSKLISEIAFIKLSTDNYNILSQLAFLGIFCLGIFKANIGISEFVPKPAAARKNEILLVTISNRFFWCISGIKILVDLMLNLRAEQMQWNYKNIAFYGIMLIILCVQQKRTIKKWFKITWSIFKEDMVENI